MTILKLYKCIKSNDEKIFAVGEIYPLYNNGGKNYIVANNNVNWYENQFPFIERNCGVKFDEVKEKTLINNQQKIIDKYNQLIKKYKELSNQIYDLENENEELKSKIYDLEVNKQTLEGDNTYWRESAIYWRDKYVRKLK